MTKSRTAKPVLAERSLTPAAEAHIEDRKFDSINVESSIYKITVPLIQDDYPIDICESRALAHDFFDLFTDLSVSSADGTRKSRAR